MVPESRDDYEELEGALDPHRKEERDAAVAEVAARLNMTAGSVQVAVHRLRRRYGELLRAEIAHTVSRAEEIDGEIRHLFAALRG